MELASAKQDGKQDRTGGMSLLRQSHTELVLLCLLIAALPRNDGASIVVLWLAVLPSKQFACIQTWCAPSLRGCTGSVKLYKPA